MFTFAYSWNLSAGRGNPLNDCIQNQVDLMIGDSFPQYHSVFNRVRDYFSTSDYAGYISGAPDVTSLLNDLGNDQDPQNGDWVKNFYWYGDCNGHTLNGKGVEGVGITANAIANAVNNKTIFYPNPIASPIAMPPIMADYWEHPYRFVFLDCCDAGKDDAFAKSFGIPDNLTLSQVSGHHEKMQAFLGWNGTVFSLAGDGFNDYSLTLQIFFYLWEAGVPLKDCVKAVSYKTVPDAVGRVNISEIFSDQLTDGNQLRYPLGQPAASNGRGSFDYGSLVKIYGYPDIVREFEEQQ